MNCVLVPESLVCAGLTLVAGLCAVFAALCRAETARKPLRVAELAAWALWGSGCAFLILERLAARDWMHLYWAAELPLVCLFSCSGVLLRRGPRGVLLFLGICICFGVLPLLLQIALPPDDPAPREIGAPVRRLWELARWGLGGSLPECLELNTGEEFARGVGHLPREVTVPMGTTLIAAGLWVAFLVLALASRLVRSERIRSAFCLLAPIVLLVASWIWGPGLDGAIWTSDPVLMRSYGPTLLVAALGLGALGWLSASARRR